MSLGLASRSAFGHFSYPVEPPRWVSHQLFFSGRISSATTGCDAAAYTSTSYNCSRYYPGLSKIVPANRDSKS